MPQDTDQSGINGTSLLVMITVATLVCTALIAGYCVLGAWWLLPLVVVAILGVTAAMVAVLMHIMDDDGLGAH